MALVPTFESLPHNSEGRLASAAVRYLLHRYFVDRHGWYVQGLDIAGQAWNSSSPTDALGRQASSELKNIFEQRLSARGLSLHEVAVLAATVEGLVHKEMLDRLKVAYWLANRPVADNESETRAVGILDLYMLMYSLGLNHTRVTRSEIRISAKNVLPQYLSLVQWVHQVRDEVLASSPANRTSFATSARVLEEVADRHGRWQQQECLTLKESLVQIGQPDTGRVPLQAFYGAALNGNWQFSEKLEYLQQLGALDDSDASRPSVIIPNYINGPSNCVASSAFYSVCCISECEAIQGHIERRLAAPDAEPGRIAEVVASLPSASVAAPRTLPTHLVQRLGDIASQHGGFVPLHSRLFAQWLHHAYPLECPFPQLSATLHPMTVDAFLQRTGEDATADEQYMRRHLSELRQAQAKRPHAAGSGEMPWLPQEEMYVGSAGRANIPVSMSVADVKQGVFVVATVVAASLVVTLLRSLAGARSAYAAQPHLKLSV